MKKVWMIFYPLFYYYAIMLIVMTIAQWIFGSDNAHFVLCQLISTVVTIPCILPLYREAVGQSVYGANTRPAKQSDQIVAIVVVVACISIALNNLISMTPLVEMSTGYQEANAGFYGSTLALELLSSALLTPILEELVFRGILFTNLRQMLPRVWAVLISALLFACVHWNIVQFIYALFLGIVLALLMEHCGHVYAAIVGHITANFIAVIRTETGVLDWMVQGDTRAWIVSVLLLVLGVLVLIRAFIIQEIA
jgi:hypothetical protein